MVFMLAQFVVAAVSAGPCTSETYRFGQWLTNFTCGLKDSYNDLTPADRNELRFELYVSTSVCCKVAIVVL
jgi:hypothetical protein